MQSYTERLIILREKNGVTQKQIADLLHIDRFAYQRFEDGRIDPPLSSIIKIADYFNVSIDYLVERTSISTLKRFPNDIE